MNILDPREPFCAWSHAAGLLLALPLTFLLWRFAGGDRGKRLTLGLYGLTMATCYSASMLFHSVRGPDAMLRSWNRLDHVGIYLFIAGTYTSIAWNLLRSGWR